MANILDYLIPDTMRHVRNVQRWENAREQQDEIKSKQAAIETLKAFMSQPDEFEGVQQDRVPTPEVLAAYAKAKGTSWPMAQNPQAETGGPPPGVTGGTPFASMDQPKETLAVMRSPLSQTSNEIGQKAVADAMAKLKVREANLANEGDLSAREFERQAQAIPGKIETLGGILKPYGYDDADIAAQVTGKYPGARASELKRQEHYPPRDTSPKLYATEEGWMPYEDAIGKKGAPRAGAGGAGGAGGEKVPPQVKQAQDLIKRLVPAITGQINPTAAILLSMNPDNARNPMVQQAISGAQLPAELKSLYDQAVQVLNTYYGVTQQPPAGAAGADQNDPLGILK